MNRLDLTGWNPYNKAAESGASTPPPGLSETDERTVDMPLANDRRIAPSEQSRTSDEHPGLVPIGIIVARLMERLKGAEE